MTTTRRDLLTRSVLGLGTACAAPLTWVCPDDDPLLGGTFIDVVPFTNEPPPRFGEPTGAGWDGRLRYDLARIDMDGLITPTDLHFIRTFYPDQLDTSLEDWRILVHGQVKAEAALTIADLRALEADQGEITLECSGNADGSGFGLLSSARWSGAPLIDVLEASVDLDPTATRVLVAGFDDHAQPSTRSDPGASWIFTLDELRTWGTFLALSMNDAPLPPDHGFPVRLLTPRWYGCTCIKWVNEIRLVGDDEPSTSQMREFARRTHQDGTPELARDFKPAHMQRSALPVRIEKWLVDDQVTYRILGVAWGGDGPSGRLVIDIDGDEAAVTQCDAAPNPNLWSRWEYLHTPRRTGEARVRLRVDDPMVAQIRLDGTRYHRTFEIDEA